MFACRFPKHLNLTTYDSAVALWEKSPKKRGYSDPDWRSPFDRPRDSTIVRKDSKDQIHLRLFTTDVVTFSPDNTVTLDPVTTASTNAFVWAVLGGHASINTHWTDRQHPCPDKMTQVGGKFYHTPEFVHLTFDESGDRGQWRLLGGSRSVQVPSLDKSKTMATLKSSGFRQFELWLKTQIRLGLDPRGNDRYYDHYRPSTEVVRSLDEPDRYLDIARGMSVYRSVGDLMDTLRLAVYKYHDLTDTVEVPHFDSYAEMAAAFAKMRKYS